jgi:cyclopropane-fatty-acyl-phospholipid synthase
MFFDPLIRFVIRRLIDYRLRVERKRFDDVEYWNQFLWNLKSSPIALKTDLSKKQHYEVPTEFYQNVMGANLKYSCGLWLKDTDTLDESEAAMLECYCERAQLKDGLSILELGCGWGSLSLYLAKKYPQSQILAVSHSATQKLFIESACQTRGIHNLTVQTADMNDFHCDQTFDRILSIEMFEHMRNYEKLLENLARWGKPQALLFVHIFSHRDLAYLFEKGWMAEKFSGKIRPIHLPTAGT